jgi:hypothetical protein
VSSVVLSLTLDAQEFAVAKGSRVPSSFGRFTSISISSFKRTCRISQAITLSSSRSTTNERATYLIYMSHTAIPLDACLLACPFVSGAACTLTLCQPVVRLDSLLHEDKSNYACTHLSTFCFPGTQIDALYLSLNCRLRTSLPFPTLPAPFILDFCLELPLFIGQQLSRTSSQGPGLPHSFTLEPNGARPSRSPSLTTPDTNGLYQYDTILSTRSIYQVHVF